jgi:hypothetical protein
MKITFDESNEYLTTHAGLTIIGALLSKTQLRQRVGQAALPEIKTSPDISNGDVLASYIGLLCQGKSDFDHIEPFRKDDAFSISLQIKDVPSSPTLRQRLDMAGKLEGTADWKDILLQESADLLKQMKVTLTPVHITLPGGKEQEYLPLDIDVSPFDNSNTKKEGVSYTYKGHDGYAPIFAYLGSEGYGVNVELREGKTHCQSGTAEFLKETIGYARRITNRPLLVRMDSGNDSKDNLKVCHSSETKADYIIKRNLRKESKEAWLTIAQEKGICCEPREGKKVYIGFIECKEKGFTDPLRMVFRVIERTIRSDGQILLIPEIEVDAYWTSLLCAPWRVIELYRDHGTSEQFHSEIKTDLDLERLPAGKFKTNDLILHAGLFAYNLLRLTGQESLREPDAPIRHHVQRRRIRTVIQNMMYLAARVVRHARQIKFRFGCYSPWFPTIKRVYQAISQ